MSQLDEFLQKEYAKAFHGLSVDQVFAGELSFPDWKKELREKIRAKLVYDVDYEVPSCKEECQIRKEGYSIRQLSFSLEGLSCPLYILLPESEPRGLVLALHGHGYGVRDIIGEISEDTYQKRFALELCRQGFAVAAPELIGFGTMRLDEDIRSGNPKQSSCHRLSMDLLAEGKTLLGLRVREASAALSLARSLFPHLKAGVMGISGGGTVTAFLSSLRDDISAAVISGYANYFRTSILAMHHCVCNYLPGMLSSFELPDVLALIAPVPMLWESGSDDPIYPNSAAREAEAAVRKCYSLSGKPDCFCCDYFAGVHEIHGIKAYGFLHRWLI